MDTNGAITCLTCIIMLFLVGKIFILPMKSIIKLILNSIIGAIIIYIINKIGAIWGFNIGLNWITSIFVGVLGIPGAILLIILKIFLGE